MTRASNGRTHWTRVQPCMKKNVRFAPSEHVCLLYFLGGYLLSLVKRVFFIPEQECSTAQAVPGDKLLEP